MSKTRLEKSQLTPTIRKDLAVRIEKPRAPRLDTSRLQPAPAPPETSPDEHRTGKASETA